MSESDFSERGVAGRATRRASARDGGPRRPFGPAAEAFALGPDSTDCAAGGD